MADRKRRGRKGWHVESQERRRHRRLRLKFPVVLAGGGDVSGAAQQWVTSNVSAGGMFIQVPRECASACGEEVAFEMEVPPGAGYSAQAGKIKGAGRVVRAEPLGEGAIGMAVQFTDPLALEF